MSLNFFHIQEIYSFYSIKQNEFRKVLLQSSFAISVKTLVHISYTDIRTYPNLAKLVQY